MMLSMLSKSIQYLSQHEAILTSILNFKWNYEDIGFLLCIRSTRTEVWPNVENFGIHQ